MDVESATKKIPIESESLVNDKPAAFDNDNQNGMPEDSNHNDAEGGIEEDKLTASDALSPTGTVGDFDAPSEKSASPAAVSQRPTVSEEEEKLLELAERSIDELNNCGEDTRLSGLIGEGEEDEILNLNLSNDLDLSGDCLAADAVKPSVETKHEHKDSAEKVTTDSKSEGQNDTETDDNSNSVTETSTESAVPDKGTNSGEEPVFESPKPEHDNTESDSSLMQQIEKHDETSGVTESQEDITVGGIGPKDDIESKPAAKVQVSRSVDDCLEMLINMADSEVTSKVDEKSKSDDDILYESVTEITKPAKRQSSRINPTSSTYDQGPSASEKVSSTCKPTSSDEVCKFASQFPPDLVRRCIHVINNFRRKLETKQMNDVKAMVGLQRCELRRLQNDVRRLRQTCAEAHRAVERAKSDCDRANAERDAALLQVRRLHARFAHPHTSTNGHPTTQQPYQQPNNRTSFRSPPPPLQPAPGLQIRQNALNQAQQNAARKRPTPSNLPQPTNAAYAKQRRVSLPSGMPSTANNDIDEVILDDDDDQQQRQYARRTMGDRHVPQRQLTGDHIAKTNGIVYRNAAVNGNNNNTPNTEYALSLVRRALSMQIPVKLVRDRQPNGHEKMRLTWELPKTYPHHLVQEYGIVFRTNPSEGWQPVQSFAASEKSCDLSPKDNALSGHYHVGVRPKLNYVNPDGQVIEAEGPVSDTVVKWDYRPTRRSAGPVNGLQQRSANNIAIVDLE